MTKSQRDAMMVGWCFYTAIIAIIAGFIHVNPIPGASLKIIDTITSQLSPLVMCVGNILAGSAFVLCFIEMLYLTFKTDAEEQQQKQEYDEWTFFLFWGMLLCLALPLGILNAGPVLLLCFTITIGLIFGLPYIAVICWTKLKSAKTLVAI